MKVDTRAGSKDLIEPLQALGVLVTPEILAAGDIEILGNGPKGRPMLIGVEYKSIEDTIQCMRNGRFAEQLRGMKESFEVCWLLIEGRWEHFEPKESLAVRRGNTWFEVPGHVCYQEVAAWTASMAQSAGALLWRTETREESVAWLRALELWWTAKEYEEHRAHLEWYTPPIGTNPFEGPPPLVRRWANELPRVGPVMSGAVAERFKSARKMADATPEEWDEIAGIGKKLAANIVRAIEEEG